jgi:hypothetical protein
MKSCLLRTCFLGLVFLAGCWEEKVETPNQELPPLNPKLLDEPKPPAQENLGGLAPDAPDSIEEEGAELEPLPPASPGSPYRSTPGRPARTEK